jgi:hypothetical protein
MLDACGRRFQVKINPGAPIQIVQNGITIRHPALPPVPESPPQPLPPLNLEVLTTSFPALPTQFISNPQQQLSVAAAGTSSIFSADGPYHNIFKRERNEPKKREVGDETAVLHASESQKEIAKRSAEKPAETDDDKVSIKLKLFAYRSISSNIDEAFPLIFRSNCR